MALMLIIAGALLALGGLASLFSGFDHMTTERGAAATIAGVTAISGGLITLGLGFVVARLTQILAASETEEAEQSAEANTAPATITSAEEPKPQEASAPKDERDTLLRNPLGRRPEGEDQKLEAEEKTSSASGLLKRLSLGKASVAAGAVAGTVAAGTVASSAMLSPATQDDKTADPDKTKETNSEENNKLDAVSASPEVALNAMDAEIDAKLASALSQSPVDKAKQLEDELAAALEEEISPTSKTAIIETVEAPQLEVVEQVADEIEPDPTPAAKPTRGRRKFSEMLESKAAKAEKVPEIEEVAADETTAPDATAAALEEAEPVDLAGATETVASEEKDAEQEAPAADQPAVLGRYVRDGHTYTLYSDGSVEALTETGVKRYSSMEELRSELSQG